MSIGETIFLAVCALVLGMAIGSILGESLGYEKSAEAAVSDPQPVWWRKRLVRAEADKRANLIEEEEASK